MNSIRNHLRVYDDGRVVALQIVYGSKNVERINEVLKDWSFRGINQHMVTSGRHRLNSGAYGDLLMCLKAIFDVGKDSFYVDEFEETEIVRECGEYWEIFSRTM